MELPQSWTASSQDICACKSEGLDHIAENWSSQVQVIITRPTVLVHGPIETRPEYRKVRLVREAD
jgi:hypothetical protein